MVEGLNEPKGPPTGVPPVPLEKPHAPSVPIPPLNPTVNFAIGDSFIEKRDAMKPSLMSRFDDFERILNSNGKKFFIDDTPHACDFAVFHHLDLSKKLDNSIINQFPSLLKFIDNISSLSSISSYLDNRSELIDVSVEPKLVIDGSAHPTGIKKT